MNIILHSTIIGEGKPFVILHGFLGMSDNWKTLGKKIAAEGFQVHLVDQRNHGRSPHSNSFSYEVMALDLKQYCEHHQLERIHLLGHSMGGKTAMLFAVHYPEVIEKIVIADIGPKYYPLHHQDILDGLDAIDFEEVTSRNEADMVLKSYVPDPGIRMFLLKNLYWVTKGELGFRMNLDVLTAQVLEIGKPLEAQYSYEKEILFLKGSKSQYIQEEDKDKIVAQFPLAIFKEIANAGHWLHAENPSDFMQKVLEFSNKQV